MAQGLLLLGTMGRNYDTRLISLIEGGEWACSWGDAGGLAHVCRQLAEITDGEVAERARRVVELLESAADEAAFHEWADLASSEYPDPAFAQH